MPINNHVTIVTKRIEYEDYYFLILPDIAAGSKGRYTVYRISSSPGTTGRCVVIGRELKLAYCKKLVAKYPKPKRLETRVQLSAKAIAKKIAARLATAEGKAALAKAGKESRERAADMVVRTRALPIDLATIFPDD